MKQCKNCLEMYGHSGGTGKFRLFGDYCPFCGSFNSGFDKYQIIGFLLAILVGLIIYLTTA
jgi:hypothetical protein